MDATHLRNNHSRPAEGRIYLVARDDGAVRVGWAQNLKSRLSKLKSDHGKAPKLLCSFPADKVMLHEARVILAPYKLTRRWYRACPEVNAFIQGVLFARGLSTLREDHMDVEVLTPSEAIVVLEPWGITEHRLAQWADPGKDVLVSEGGSLYYKTTYVNRVLLSLRSEPQEEPSPEYTGISF